MSSQQFFAWDEDVPIPFRLNDLDERVVSGDSVITMVRSVLFHYGNEDSPIGPLSPQEVISDITGLLKTYQPDVDEVIVPKGFDSLPLCDEEGHDIDNAGLCVCGHAIAAHQTGEGPWSGFCGDTDCKCEEVS